MSGEHYHFSIVLSALRSSGLKLSVIVTDICLETKNEESTNSEHSSLWRELLLRPKTQQPALYHNLAVVFIELFFSQETVPSDGDPSFVCNDAEQGAEH